MIAASASISYAEDINSNHLDASLNRKKLLQLPTMDSYPLMVHLFVMLKKKSYLWQE
jgi:hypothetical protein